MDQQKRLFLTLALSLGLIMAFQVFVWGPEQNAEHARLSPVDAGNRGGASDAGAAAGATFAEAPALRADAREGGAEDDAPLRRLALSRATTALVFSTEGGAVSEATLLGARERQEEKLSIPEGYRKLFGAKFPPPPQVNLAISPTGGPGQFAVSIDGARPVSARQRYSVAEETAGRVVFTASVDPWVVTKTFTWDPSAGAEGRASSSMPPSGYAYTLEVVVRNASTSAQTGELVLHTARSIDPGTETAPSMFGGIGNEASVLCRVSDEVKRVAPSKDAQPTVVTGKVSFVGIDQQYFLSAAWPKGQGADGRCVLSATPLLRRADLISGFALNAGESWTRSFGLFLGPKEADLLAAVDPKDDKSGSAVATHPLLESTVDYGMWAVICKALNFFLRYFHGLLGNWGLAIIALTVMVKVALLPLTHKAMVSAEQMKKLQPKMEQLKAKFPDDRERQNAEMMKLYQEAKVNPLGGCLPVLVQLPIWGALFTTLRTSYELYGEPFFGVWSDLTTPDPTYLLPLALGVTMIVTQRLQPQMMDKSQAFLITWVMPVFFTALMMNYPAGLALYIFTNNLLSIVQQYALKKYLEKRAENTVVAQGS
jgi:YidC/Oxa1 family membrane protein insertase